MEDLFSKALIYLLSLLSKPLLVIGGWLVSLILLVSKNEKIPAKELIHRIVASFLSVPFSMAVDSYYTMNKWTLCFLVVFSGYFMWYILQKTPGIIDNRLDSLLDKFKSKTPEE